MNTWKNILISFSIVSFACAIKNYCIYLWSDSSYFVYFAPSFFGEHSFYITPYYIEILYDFQKWVVTITNSLGATLFNDQYQVLSILLIAPIAEEIIYRLPLFTLKSYLNSYIYWAFAVTLSSIFAHSHDLYGISLLPVFVLGMCCSWLIKVEKVFWPCFALHSIFNFYSLSFSFYQSIFGGD